MLCELSHNSIRLLALVGLGRHLHLGLQEQFRHDTCKAVLQGVLQAIRRHGNIDFHGEQHIRQCHCHRRCAFWSLFYLRLGQLERRRRRVRFFSAYLPGPRLQHSNAATGFLRVAHSQPRGVIAGGVAGGALRTYYTLSGGPLYTISRPFRQLSDDRVTKAGTTCGRDCRHYLPGGVQLG